MHKWERKEGFMNTWLDKLQRRFGRIRIENLMFYIVLTMGAVFIIDYCMAFSPVDFSLSSFIYFDRDAIFAGQLWRVISFIFMPVGSNILFFMFSLYFYWLIGSALESEWGVFKFNLFYLFGIVGSIIFGFITGYATNYYLNLSLFLAFALLYPDYTISLFMIIPIKVKYIAILDAVYLVYLMIVGSWQSKIALMIAMVNLIIFFGGNFTDRLKNAKRRYEFRRNLRGRK